MKNPNSKVLPRVPANAAAVKKFYRVTWTEQYEQVREAASAEAAEEERDDKDAFQGCMELTSQEVKPCPKCQGRGRGDHGGHCGACESGWVPVVQAY